MSRTLKQCAVRQRNLAYDLVKQAKQRKQSLLKNKPAADVSGFDKVIKIYSDEADKISERYGL